MEWPLIKDLKPDILFLEVKRSESETDHSLHLMFRLKVFMELHLLFEHLEPGILSLDVKRPLSWTEHAP
jgi:hypothetical protein